jgi:hypothetical protein
VAHVGDLAADGSFLCFTEGEHPTVAGALFLAGQREPTAEDQNEEPAEAVRRALD